MRKTAPYLLAALFMVAPAQSQELASWDLSRFMSDSDAGVITLLIDPQTQDSAFVFYVTRPMPRPLPVAQILLIQSGECFIMERTILNGQSALTKRRIRCEQFRALQTRFDEAAQQAMKYAGMI